ARNLIFVSSEVGIPTDPAMEADGPVGNLRDASFTELVALLKRDDLNVVQAAIEELGELGNLSAGPYLINLLGHKGAKIDWAIQRSMQRLGLPVPELVRPSLPSGARPKAGRRVHPIYDIIQRGQLSLGLDYETAVKVFEARERMKSFPAGFFMNEMTAKN